MKRTSTALSIAWLMIMLLWNTLSAQYAINQTLKLNHSYVAGLADTTASVRVGSYNRVGVLFVSRDSVNVKLYVETQVYGGSTWTLADSVSIASTLNAGARSEWILRDNTTEKIPGVSNYTRFRAVFAETGQGVSSARYDLMLSLSR